MATNVSGVTSHFPDAENGFTTTTAGSIASAAATVPLNSVSGYTNGQPVVLVIDPTDPAKKQTFTGIVDTSGVQITSVVWTAGTNQIHALGATVVDYATATHIAMISKGIQVEHEQDGTHTNITQADANYIKDDAGNELLKWSKTASAVNEVTIKNAATATDPRISASGGDTNVNLNLRGKGLAKTVTIGAGATTIFPYDYVVSGCQWTGDSYGVNRNASMTAGVACINGNPVTVTAVVARTFTASKDTYCDVLDNGDGTGLLVYTEVTNNAASPALAANSIRLAIVVTGATFIPNVLGAVNWGQEYVTLPLISSVALSVTDSLGNLICPRDPHCKTLGYRQIVSNFTTTTTPTLVDVTGLSVPFIVPTGRKIKAIAFSPTNQTSGVAGSSVTFQITESSTQLAAVLNTSAGASYHNHQVAIAEPSAVSAGLHTYKVQASQAAAGTLTVNASATNPAWIRIELV